MYARFMCTLIMLVLAAGATAQAVSSQASPGSAAMSRAQAPAWLPISYGDLIDVSVFGSPELSGELRVNRDGDVVLPIGGAVKVNGLTAAEAGPAIAERLKEAQILLAPQVTVMIIEYPAQTVTVTGEVHSPGVYPLLTSRTVMDMIALAGGLTENAGKVASVFHRGDPSQVIQVPLDVSVQTPASATAESMEVEPGDTISVDRSGVIYVIGDVGRPGGYLVEHNDRLSILQALSLAGGANQTALLKKSELIRKAHEGRVIYDLDLHKILSGGASDPLLADGDILYVPVSNKKVYTLRAIEAMFGIGTQITIYKGAGY